MNVLTHCIHFIITLYIYSFIICRNIYWKIKKKNRKENASRQQTSRRDIGVAGDRDLMRRLLSAYIFHTARNHISTMSTKK